MKIYDCVIVGGGYAGLSAAIYLARFNRSTIIIDKGDGRWNTYEYNENYFGFPKGIKAKRLRELGLKQALRFGAKYLQDEIIDVKKQKDIFICEGKNDKYSSRTIILATGVIDLFPHFENWQDYVGKSLFWCITCDGYKTIGKKVAVIGCDNEAVETCMQFLNFTNDLVFITNKPKGEDQITEKWESVLKKYKIPYFEEIIEKVNGKNGMLKEIILSNNYVIPLNYMFNQQGMITNCDLAKKIGVKTDDKGYILTDENQRTNIPFVYAAGDITKAYAHQIITAAHEGSMAAQTANYDLYSPDQRIH